MTNTSNINSQLTPAIAFRRLELAEKGAYLPRTGFGKAAYAEMAELGLVVKVEYGRYELTELGRDTLNAAHNSAFAIVGSALFDAKMAL